MIQYYIELLGGEQPKESVHVHAPYECHKSEIRMPAGLEVIWLKELYSKSAPNEKGLAFLWADDDFLNVCGVFEDSDVYSLAHGKNDNPWEKGDVMEFFIQPDPNGENYFEIHLAPNNATLEYSIPSADKIDEFSKEELVFDSGLETYVNSFTHEDLKGWWGHIKIPKGNLEISPSHKESLFCVCRYNYNRKWGENPELSSTVCFRIPSYHHPESWQNLYF